MLPQPRILITRPVGQESKLANLCRAYGLSVTHLPCLEIKGTHTVGLTEQLLSKNDCALFTSRNAVIHAHKALPLPWKNLSVHAIGQATSDCLREHGQTTHLEPQAPFNSESYIQQLKLMKPQHIMIIKGVGGRGVLQTELRKMGWTIDCIDVYKRELPTLSYTSVNRLLATMPDVISVTSNESLLNLKKLAGKHWTSLLDVPMVVNSPRAKSLAESLGFSKDIEISLPAGDDGQIEAIARLLRL